MASSKAVFLAMSIGCSLWLPGAFAQDIIWQTMMDSADKSIAAHNYKQAETQLSAALKSLDSAQYKDDRLVRQTIRKLGQVYELQGQCNQAEAILLKLVASDEKRNAPELAEDLRTLGIVHHKLGKCDDAERELKRAAAVYEKSKGGISGVDATSGVLIDLAVMYQDQGKFPLAEETLKKSIALAQQGGSKKTTAQAMEKLAKLYTTQNRMAEAEPILKMSLKLMSESISPSSPTAPEAGGDVAQHLIGLGKLYQEQGNLTEAEKHFKQAVSQIERDKSATDPSVATALLALADFYRAQLKASQAIPMYERAISVREKNFGVKSTEVAEANRKLAEMYMDTDKYERAEELYKQVLHTDESAFGAQSREVAKDLSNLALLYVNQGRYRDAESLYKRSLAIVQQAVGPDHPDTATCLNNLAFLYKNEGKLAESESLIRKGLLIREQVLGKEHPAVARNLANLAEVYMVQRRWTDAEPLLRQAIQIEKATLESSHPDIAVNMRDLAAVLEAQKKWQGAETLYRDLLEFDQQQKLPDSMVASDMDGLVRALLAQGKKEEATPLASRAVFIKEKLPGAVIGGANQSSSSTSSQTGSSVVASKPIKDKWALVVGISNFQDPSMNLKFASKDATDFRNYLVEEAHFQPDHVKLLTDKDATRQNIVSSLGDAWLKRVANSDDLVVIYLSTHGSSAKQEAGQANFIVPYDGNLENIVFNGIPMQWLTAGIKDMIHSDRIVLLLDVCHGGAVADGAKGIRRGEAEFDPSKLGAGDGQIVVASSQADQISWESKKYPNSVFTRRLLEGLRSGGDLTKIRDAYAYMKEKVEEEVLRDRAYLQTPVLVTKWWQGEDIAIGTPPTSPRPGLEAGAVNAALPVAKPKTGIPSSKSTPVKSSMRAK